MKVLDLTNLPYDEAQVKLLCRGFTFTPTPSPNEIEIKADIQEFCRKLRLREYFLDSHQEPKLVHNKSNFKPPNQRNEELDEVIQEITEVNAKKHTPKDNLSKSERQALQQLKSNKRIVIKGTDKGGSFVIMSKEQYEEMVMKHLNTDTYKQVVNKNIDKKVVNKIEDFTNDYSDILEPEETKHLTDFKYSTSNFYVLPKVHKSKEITRFLETSPVDYLKVKDPPEIPSRPIVAGPNSPTHRLSTFLDIIIRPLTEIVKSYVRDDLDFLHHLPKDIDFDSTFISLDVTSLYTNITHDRGIEGISYWIDQYLSHLVEERFTKEFIAAGLTLVLKNNYFKFNGTTMGSNVSVIFAILFMAYLEIHIYQNVRQMYPQDYAEYLIKAWKRFIDDCLVIWNKKFDFTPLFLHGQQLGSVNNIHKRRGQQSTTIS